MNFASLSDLATDCQNLACSSPETLVGVVGLPRSGMIAASMIAAHRGVHLSDLESFVRSGGAFYRAGRRMNYTVGAKAIDPAKPQWCGHVLVVDDSVRGGQAMDAARSAIYSSPILASIYTIEYAAVYCAPGGERCLHYWQRMMEVPRIFQWNVWTSDVLATAMVDLDGVLCWNPLHVEPEQPNDHDYLAHVRGAPRLFVPRRPIGCVVTGRLGVHYRQETHEWLTRAGIEFHSLAMSPHETVQARRERGPGLWKGELYAGAEEMKLFIESSPSEADQIFEIARKPVLCVADWKLRK